MEYWNFHFNSFHEFSKFLALFSPQITHLKGWSGNSCLLRNLEKYIFNLEYLISWTWNVILTKKKFIYATCSPLQSFNFHFSSSYKMISSCNFNFSSQTNFFLATFVIFWILIFTSLIITFFCVIQTHPLNIFNAKPPCAKSISWTWLHSDVF